ncbi:MAG: hypothetical protein OXG39_01520 [Chloroflexi bacterium]|nr:hypothetical protein [Chloroflexota bacterium]
MDIEDKLNQHERSIGWIEGKLESLATKEFVRKEVNDAVKTIDAKIDAVDAKIDSKIDALNKDISGQIKELSNKIEKERSWRMKVTGGVSILALVFVAISSLVTTLVSLGIISA